MSQYFADIVLQWFDILIKIPERQYQYCVFEIVESTGKKRSQNIQNFP